jgi:hypothetical protein
VQWIIPQWSLIMWNMETEILYSASKEAIELHCIIMKAL